MTEPTQTPPTAPFNLNVDFMFKGPWAQIWIDAHGITCNTGTPIVGEAFGELGPEHFEAMNEALSTGTYFMLRDTVFALHDAVVAKIDAHIKALPVQNRQIEAVFDALDLPLGQTVTVVLSNQPALDVPFMDAIAKTRDLIRDADNSVSAPRPR